MSDKYTAEQMKEAIKHLRMLCDYAYEKGFHELGYDPVEVVSQAAQMMREREVGGAVIEKLHILPVNRKVMGINDLDLACELSAAIGDAK